MSKSKDKNKLDTPLDQLLKAKKNTNNSNTQEIFKNAYWKKYFISMKEVFDGLYMDMNILRTALKIKVNDDGDKILRPMQKVMKGYSKSLEELVNNFAKDL